jgi:undecaprenyl pyrophosphate synthase
MVLTEPGRLIVTKPAVPQETVPEETVPQDLIDFFREQEERFISKNGKYVILAVNYGGRDEIIRGIKKYINKQ